MKKTKQKLFASILGIFLFAVANLPTTAFAQDYEDSPFGFKDAYMLRVDLHSWWNEYPEAMEDLGAFWHEPAARYGFRWHEIQDTLPGGGYSEYHWDHYDSIIVHAQAGNILISAQIIATKPQFPSFSGHVLPSLPTDMNAYRTFVAALVDRYNGDGQNDMPGLLYPVRRWKIEDEAMASRFWGGTGAELAVLMTNAYEVIKDTDTEASVISTMVINFIGLGNPANQFMNEFFDELENLGGERPYDIMDIHYMPTDPNTPKRKQYLQIKDLMDEVSLATTSHGFTLAPYEALEVAGCNRTEQEQAEDLIRRYVYPLSLGFEKIFWSGIKAVVNGDTTDAFVRNVLILADDTKKLSYYTYKKMTEKLEGSDWDNITTVIDSINNKYAYKFINDSTEEPTYVAWWDYFDDISYSEGDSSLITLTGISSNQVIVTDAVPNYPSGNYVTNYNTAFSIDTLNVTSGSVSFYLKEDPVFVEEISSVLSNQTIFLHKGWSGLSSYIKPENDSLENIFGQIIDQLIILQTMENNYQPEQNINTIGLWDTHQGYKIKVTEDIELNISGTRENSNTVQLTEGWNLIPVFSEHQVNVEVIFNGTGLVIVKEVAGWNVYWPGMSINTIEYLLPGKAYFVLMNSGTTITYPVK